MDTTIYTDGTYLQNNPAWHADDSPWKASHIAALLARNGIQPQSVCEIGCGAGEILRSLSTKLDPATKFFGYEISGDAYRLCSRHNGGNFHFKLASLLDEQAHFDVVMAIDVFEHVEDCFGFLRKLRGKATHKVFHIPLDLSAWNAMRPGKLMELRRGVGHIHYFTKETALALLHETGYRVLDHAYTSGGTDLPNLGWKTRLLKGPRKLIAAIDEDAAARILGGYSLLVLAE